MSMMFVHSRNSLVRTLGLKRQENTSGRPHIHFNAMQNSCTLTSSWTRNPRILGVLEGGKLVGNLAKSF